mmetsp:Transcript_60690/g.112601  ORF Transcript_60690/g.112601 Transcript_60690/m.112601 type:complete len:440 (+) Transcript_60690:118-1437(+)
MDAASFASSLPLDQADVVSLYSRRARTLAEIGSGAVLHRSAALRFRHDHLLQGGRVLGAFAAAKVAKRRFGRLRRRQVNPDVPRQEVAPSSVVTDKVALILNPKARHVNKSTVRSAAAIAGKEHTFECSTLESLEDALRTILQRGYSVVACGGGDGTVAVLLNTLARICEEWTGSSSPTDWPTLAVLPLGTGNALSRLIGSGKPLADLRRLTESAGGHSSLRELSAVHPLIVNKDTLCFFAGLGIDAWWLADYEKLKKQTSGVRLLGEMVKQVWFGYLCTFLTKTLPGVIRGKYQPFRISLRSVGEAYRIDPRRGDVAVRKVDDSLLYSGECWIVAAGTMPFYGAGLRLFPFAGMRPGFMHIRVSRVNPAWCLFRWSSIWTGHFRHADCFDFLVREAEIEMQDGPELLQHSGELMGRQKKVSLRAADDCVRLTDFWDSS